MQERELLLEPPPRARRVFTNRTLNLRSLEAVGFDMDYTLIHYRAEEWERRAYTHTKRHLLDRELPVQQLEYLSGAFTLGLIIDKELGNVVKANRFGFVKRAMHGTRPLEFEEQRRVYSRTQVDLSESRWEFMSTLFSLSETCLYAQLVELLDAGKLPRGMAYRDVYQEVRATLDRAHMEGALKGDIIQRPEDFVVLDEELPLALLDLKHAGKKLLLITNSDFAYVNPMMQYAFERFLGGTSWRSLFEIAIVSARKPDFFTGNAPMLEVVDEAGLLRARNGPLRSGGVYFGGNARLVEDLLGCPGEQILYVGDHIFSDVHVTKNLLRWRTALILRELEDELRALEMFTEKQQELDRLMAEKERLEHAHDALRLELQRRQEGYGPKTGFNAGRVKRELSELRAALNALDDRIAPLSRSASQLFNPGWGPLLRAGNDKSHLARQIERHADVYTSRVSNLLFATPFAYLRSPRGSLPHDPGP